MLSAAAGLATCLGVWVYNAHAFIYALSLYAIVECVLIVVLVTFIISQLGFIWHQRYRWGRLKAVCVGYHLGLLAFAISALFSIFALVSPPYYVYAFPYIMEVGFVLGGFLAPLVGAVTGYRLAEIR